MMNECTGYAHRERWVHTNEWCLYVSIPSQGPQFMVLPTSSTPSPLAAITPLSIFFISLVNGDSLFCSPCVSYNTLRFEFYCLSSSTSTFIEHHTSLRLVPEFRHATSVTRQQSEMRSLLTEAPATLQTEHDSSWYTGQNQSLFLSNKRFLSVKLQTLKISGFQKRWHISSVCIEIRGGS